ncbi:MAG: cupin domain-containing protein [Cryobacterium sp.]|nr:cupin domain-containing protein [Cryobacterium sp.]
MGGTSRDFDEGAVVSAAELTLLHSPVPAEQLVEGTPTASAIALGTFAGQEVGVWEHTPGTSTDVEADELFIVLSGSATVHFVDEERTVHLTAGSVMQLFAGQRTEWTVTETLRKVYVA